MREYVTVCTRGKQDLNTRPFVPLLCSHLLCNLDPRMCARPEHINCIMVFFHSFVVLNIDKIF